MGSVGRVSQLINELGSVLVDLASEISVKVQIVLPFVKDERLTRVEAHHVCLTDFKA